MGQTSQTSPDALTLLEQTSLDDYDASSSEPGDGVELDGAAGTITERVDDQGAARVRLHDGQAVKVSLSRLRPPSHRAILSPPETKTEGETKTDSETE